MRTRLSNVLGIACLVLTAAAGRADALTTITVDKCLATQLRLVAKAAAGYTACHAKAAEKAVATDTQCLGRVTLKLSSALAKLESKKTCQLEGAVVELAADAFDFAADLDATVGHAFKCDGKKMRTTAKYVTALMGCYAKAAGKTGLVDSQCVSKAVANFATAIPKEEIGIAYCSALSQIGVLGDAAAAFAEAETCKLDVGNPVCNGVVTPTPTRTPTRTPTPTGPTSTPTRTVTPTPTITATPICNDGINQPGEPCDPTAPSSGWGGCRPDQTCTACTCACPSSMVLSADAADAGSVFDFGWTGIVHRQPLVSDGTVTVQLDCPAASHPCGTCAVSGPIPNPQAGAGQIDNRRCSTNVAKHCADDAACAARTCLGGANDGASCASDSQCPAGSCPLAGTCSYYASAPFPTGAGGIAMCLVQRIASSVGGTADVDTGAAAIATTLSTGVYSPISLDGPCPRCSDTGLNDGVAGGTCDGGPRQGLACDANAVVPGRPDYGRTSLDCPPLPAALKADLAMALGNETNAVTRTLTPASPNCTDSGFSSTKCLCDTCNNANAEPCFTNADCPASGGNPGVCGGRRCLAGANLGAPCVASSECPGSTCGRPGGKPTAPTSCQEDYTQDSLADCVDSNGDDEGECVVGPTDQNCTLASGHGQRGCTTDGDCGGATGACESFPRKCFLTGGGSFQPANTQPGTDTLVAAGMADAPVGGVSHPTLGSVFCVAPVGSPPINAVTGLPGPARLTVRTTASVQP